MPFNCGLCNGNKESCQDKRAHALVSLQDLLSSYPVQPSFSLYWHCLIKLIMPWLWRHNMKRLGIGMSEMTKSVISDIQFQFSYNSLNCTKYNRLHQNKQTQTSAHRSIDSQLKHCSHPQFRRLTSNKMAVGGTSGVDTDSCQYKPVLQDEDVVSNDWFRRSKNEWGTSGVTRILLVYYK